MQGRWASLIQRLNAYFFPCKHRRKQRQREVWFQSGDWSRARWDASYRAILTRCELVFGWKSGSKAGAEIYGPNQFARQLGLHQLVPAPVWKDTENKDQTKRAEIGSASRISTLMARARQDWDRCQLGLLFSLPESPSVSPSARAHFLAFLRKQFPILAAGKLPEKTLKLFPFLETLHNDYVINQVCTVPSLPEPSPPPVSHSHKGRSRVVVADEEEDNEANLNPPSSAATTSVVPGLTYEEYERAIRHALRKKQKSQGASSNPDQAPEAGRLRTRSSSFFAGTLFPFIPPDDSTDNESDEVPLARRSRKGHSRGIAIGHREEQPMEDCLSAFLLRREVSALGTLSINPTMR